MDGGWVYGSTVYHVSLGFGSVCVLERVCVRECVCEVEVEFEFE